MTEFRVRPITPGDPTPLPDVAMEVPSCLCGREDVVHRVVAWDDVTGAAFTYLRCGACGLERLSPRPVLAEMGRFYPDSYVPFNDPTLNPRSRGERIKRLVYEVWHAPPGERSAVAAKWRWLLLVLFWPLRHHPVLSFAAPATRHVFEFGAGSGNDLVEFRDAGWTVGGCEPSGHACAVAASRGIILQACTAEAAVLPEGLGCVYMNNVFEHLHDPYLVLEKARKALEPGGLVVLVVPNHAGWAARLFGAAWPGYDPPKHIWGFTPAAMRTVLRNAGFEVVALDQKYPLSTYCWAAGITGERMPSAGWPKLRRAAMRLARRLLVASGMVAAFCGAGDYLRVVARKPAAEGTAR